MRDYCRYWFDMIGYALRGSARYYAWMLLLIALTAVGVVAYIDQLEQGLVVTNMSNQVSWGAYIANFTYLVGIAAAAMLLVVPTYVYHRSDVKEVVLIGELMAVAAIIMCLLFVTVDLGRPERFLHLMPFIGRINFPQSILAWDVVVLTGYLLLNLHIPGYLLYKKYRGEPAMTNKYLPFVFLSIVWAVSIHTVTAFLYSGFGSRPYWNSAILAPRFLVSAFASGPALMIIAFSLMRHYTTFTIQESVITMLRRIVSVALPLNLFLLGCEVFKEFYTDTTHTAAAQYLFFGLHGHGMLVPYIWSSIACSIVAIVILAKEQWYRNPRLLRFAAFLTIVGIWVEKGMGLLIPGFIPTPLGDLVEYAPSMTEFLVSVGIWSFGALLFIVSAKVAIGILQGRLRLPGRSA